MWRDQEELILAGPRGDGTQLSHTHQLRILLSCSKAWVKLMCIVGWVIEEKSRDMSIAVE